MTAQHAHSVVVTLNSMQDGQRVSQRHVLSFIGPPGEIAVEHQSTALASAPSPDPDGQLDDPDDSAGAEAEWHDRWAAWDDDRL